jgi:hypothetical protein
MISAPNSTGQEIAAALRLFIPAGQVTEIRILKAGRAGTVSGYFDNPEQAASAAISWSGKAPGVYFVPNVVNPALLARAQNRLRERVEQTTTDTDITRRRWLLIDFDPARPAGISSTDAEHQSALDRAVRCRDWLSSDGWPSPILADSGNGAHLCYPIDLPNDETSAKLIQRCLQALDLLHSDDAVQVDQKTFNAARIWKLYGTLACKGDNTPDRPHRVAKVIEIPDQLVRVPVDLLQALADRLPPEQPRQQSNGVHGSNGQANGWDLEQWITEHGLPVASRAAWNGGKKWILNPCPWNPEHTNRSAYIVQFPGGAIAAGCHHNGCAGKDWHALRDLYQPGWRERRQAAQDRAGANSSRETSDSQQAKAPSEPVLTLYSEIQPSTVRWLWKPWIPLGAISLLDGDPGLGKSTLSIDLAARVSKPYAMPYGSSSLSGPASVLLLSAEDDPAATIRPRLDVSGADPKRVIGLEAIKTEEGEQPPVLPWDLGIIEEIIQAHGIAVVIVDPLMAYLDGNIDAHRDQDIRRCLHRLKELAQRTNAAILVIRHLNKLVGGPALYRGGGSIGIVGAVRSALIVGRDPKNPHTLVLASVKNNLAPTPRSLIYSLESAGSVARIAWGGETDLTAEDILVHPTGKGEQTVGEQCADAIREILRQSPVLESDDLDLQCKKRGFTDNAMREGRRLARVKVDRLGFGPGAKYMVTLADAPASQDTQAAP